MSDLGWLAAWSVALAAGLGACLVLRAAGLASTYVRDLLHVGAGIWVFGWPWWHRAAPAIALVATVALAIALVPVLAPRLALVRRFRDSVASGDEIWDGLVIYTLTFTVFTAIALAGARFAAGAGLLALTLGDGLGGAAGRRFGRHRFAAPWGKRKSLEGSAVVALGAGTGVAIAAAYFDATITPAAVIALAIAAALAEAAAPRSTDNAIVPVVVAAGALLAR